MLLPPKVGKRESERPCRAVRTQLISTSPPLPPLQLQTQVYVSAEEVLVPFQAQHLWLLPPELLQLDFHDVHLGGERLGRERSEALSTGITPEALEQGVRQGAGVLWQEGTRITQIVIKSSAPWVQAFPTVEDDGSHDLDLSLTAPNLKDLKRVVLSLPHSPE